MTSHQQLLAARALVAQARAAVADMEHALEQDPGRHDPIYIAKNAAVENLNAAAAIHSAWLQGRP